ncbi:MAG: PspC domain-containing protein [Sulfolobales archaeon]
MKSPKRLYRSHKNRLLCGVCGGIGEYADVDPSVIRLLWVFLTVLYPQVGLTLYVVACLILPSKEIVTAVEKSGEEPSPTVNKRGNLQVAIGVVLLIGGLVIVALTLRELLRNVLRVLEAMRLAYLEAPIGMMVGVALAIVGLLLAVRHR